MLIDRIGLELVKAFLAKEDYKVIAAVRDPASMPDLGEELVVMKLDAGSKTDAAEVSLPAKFCTTVKLSEAKPNVQRVFAHKGSGSGAA